MSVTQDESFGPVLTVETFRDEDEAVAIANDSIYGLAGAVWTQDAGKAQRVAGRLRMGTVWINDYHPYVPQAEWGGYKQSGIGRELGLARARRVPRDQARLAQHPPRRAALVRRDRRAAWARTGTTSSSWVVARPDAPSPTGSPPTRHQRAGPRGRPLRLQDRPVHPHAGGAAVPDRQPALRLALRDRPRAGPERPPGVPRPRQGARRLVAASTG